MSFEAVVAIALAVNLVCALICSFVAGRSGHDPFAWVLAGGLLGPFGLVALIAVGRGDEPSGTHAPSAPRGAGGQVLLPTDGSESSLAAVEHVMRSHPPTGGVTLLAVLPVERREGALEDASSPLRRGFDEELDDHVGEARRRLERAGVTCRVETRFGDPATEIVRLAAEGGFDNIVMGRRGRGGVAKLLLGSVSDQVVKNAAIPVTVAG